VTEYQAQYDALPIEEKLRRLEWVAKCYASLDHSYLDDNEGWEEAPVLDCTKHWEDFEESLRDHIDSPQK